MKLGSKIVNFTKNRKFEIIVELKTIFSKRCPKIDETLF